MSKAKNIKEVLIAAKWMLENVGWCQGLFSKRDDSGSIKAMCLVGAINRVQLTDAGYKKLLQEKSTTMLSKLLKQDVWIWNDTEGRTKEEVISLLDRAIKKAK